MKKKRLFSSGRRFFEGVFMIFISLSVLFFQPLALFSSEGRSLWLEHLEKVKGTEGLTAFFAGESFIQSGDETSGKMKWRGETPWKESVSADGARFISLDNSSLSGKALELFKGMNEEREPICRAFTVEVRFRSLGQGELLGGNNVRNGMIACQGNGYWSGTRLVSNTDSETVSLNIGKRPSCASTSWLNRHFSCSTGSWNHVCATWDGQRMRLYLNGILAGIGEYSGPFVPDGNSWLLGNGGAGVGTLKMDICECAVYDRALEPDEIFSHAAVCGTLSGARKEILDELTESLASKSWKESVTAAEKLAESFHAAGISKISKDSLWHSPDFILRSLRIALLFQNGNFSDASDLTRKTLLDESFSLTQRVRLAKKLLSAGNSRVAEIIPDELTQILDQMIKSGELELSPRQDFFYRESKALEKLLRAPEKDPSLQWAAGEFEVLRGIAPEFFEGQKLESKSWELAYRQGTALFRAGEFEAAESIFRTLAGKTTESETSSGPGIVDLAALRRGAAREMFNQVQDTRGTAKHLVSKRTLRHHQIESSERETRQSRKNSGGSLKEGNVPDFILPANHRFGAEIQVSSFEELEAARDRLREFKTRKNDSESAKGLPEGGVKVTILPGIYRVPRTFQLTEVDSGTENAPIVYSVQEPSETVFTGGLDLTDYAVPAREIADSEALSRLEPAAQENVFAVKLSEVPGYAAILSSLKNQKLPALGRRGGGSSPDAAPWIQLYAVTDKAPKTARRGQTAELFSLARFPNEGYLTTDKVFQGLYRGETESKPPVFSVKEPLSAKRLENWRRASDAWLFGSWQALWTQESRRLRELDLSQKTIHADGAGIRENHPFFVFNVFEELDSPGEWYLDRENQTVYFWKGKFDTTKTRYVISLFDEPFIEMKGTSWVIFEGLTLEYGTRSAVKILGGEHNQLVNCVIRNFGTWGVVLTGRNSGLYACDLAGFAGGGVRMEGGKTTPEGSVPGNLFIENTEIEGFALIDLAYTAGVQFFGTGNRVSNCRIHNTPHYVFRVEGMEHTIEFCEVFDAVYQSDDQGAIDMWSNPALRGILFRNNYWHHIGTGCLESSYRQDAPSMTEAQKARRAKKLANCFKNQLCGQGGIRLDDAISSVVITGNVFQECSSKNFGCVQIHGGKDNVIDNNLFIGSVGCVSFSPWGEKRWKDSLVNKCFGFMKNVTGMSDFSESGKCPLTEKYPDLLTLRENWDRNFITRNLVLDCESFFLRDNGRNEIFANTMLRANASDFLDNPDSEQDGFLRFRIPYESPLFKAAGMTPISMESMGLYRDGRYRK